MFKELDKVIPFNIGGYEKAISIKNALLLFILLSVSISIITSVIGIFLKGPLFVLALVGGPMLTLYIMYELQKDLLGLIENKFFIDAETLINADIENSNLPK